MEGEWSCYRSNHFKWRENGPCYGGDQFKEGEWFCYRGGLLNAGRLVMLETWSVKWR